MLFAKFYTRDLNGKITEALGDRGTIILDDRYKLANNAHLARLEVKPRGFIGFSLHRGKSLSDARTVREMELWRENED